VEEQLQKFLNQQQKHLKIFQQKQKLLISSYNKKIRIDTPQKEKDMFHITNHQKEFLPLTLDSLQKLIQN